MEEAVQVEQTTEETQPEANTEEAETPEVVAEEPTEDISPEEVENTVKAEPEAPKSRASERIRELVAQKKELEARLQKQEQEPQIEGVDETGIDPSRFAQSVMRKAENVADQKYNYNRSIDEARQKFPEVAENELVGTRATALMGEGYSPVQAAEIATLEWKEATDREIKKSTQRKNAGENMRANAVIPSAGKTVKQSDGTFTRAEIAKMTPQEYTRNAPAIQSQLEKYGPESFEE